LKHQNKYLKRFAYLGTFVIIFAVAITQLNFSSLKAQAEERYSELQNFAKVLNLVQQYYVETVDTKKLIYGAIKGMLKELDPHTNFLPPDIFKDFETETSGEFGGLGIEISLQNGILTIISPIEDTAAYVAGIKSGDKIIAVDGKSTKGLSLVEASTLLRGKRGSTSTLTIVRDGEDDPIDFKITRGSVKIKSVKPLNLDTGYLYIKITSFIENTSKDLEKALADASKDKQELKGIIIDLRRNPGGLLDQAIRVSDLFLKQGVIVSTIGRDPKNKEIASATGKGKYTQVPLVVLVNEYSASASEIVSGALQDNKRAIIMGEKTFGKGSVQSIIKMGDGSGLKLTVARYYTPSGKSIQAEGIIPDINIEDVEPEAFSKSIIKKEKSLREKDMAGHLLSEAEQKQKTDKKDEPWKNAAAWYNDVASKKDAATNPKDKLLASDYQVFQAYNYLKAWKLMKGIQIE
jgi:carboxyl-terminal processing protease